jgi:hypothetical protein
MALLLSETAMLCFCLNHRLRRAASYRASGLVPWPYAAIAKGKDKGDRRGHRNRRATEHTAKAGMR